jgi:hypothetical protein
MPRLDEVLPVKGIGMYCGRDKVCQKAGYGIREKVAAREGRSPRDTLSMNLLVVYLCVVVVHDLSDRR